MDEHQGINRIDDEACSSASMEKTSCIKELQIEMRLLQLLNEDCLLKIFSSNSLTLMDLCSLAESFKLFKRIIQGVFPKQFRIESDDGADGRTYKFVSQSSSSLTTEEEIQRIVTNFGPHLHAYTSNGNDPLVMNAIVKYCNGGTLKQLDFRTMDFTEDVVAKLKSISQWLLVFIVRESRIYDDAFTQELRFDSLVELEIRSVKGFDEILRKTFPKLERLRFDDDLDCSRCKFGCDFLAQFIERHRFLRSLDTGRCYVFHMEGVAHLIGTTCTELEELTLRNSHRHSTAIDFARLQDLSRLRTLHIGIDPVEFHGIFQLLSDLKYLEIVKVSREISFSNFLSSVSMRPGFRSSPEKLTNLRELHLIGCHQSRYLPWTMFSQLKKLYVFDSTQHTELPHIVRQLESLEELEIGDLKSKLSEEDFLGIVKIFDERPNVLTLKCRIFKSCMQYINNCDASRNIKLINLR